MKNNKVLIAADHAGFELKKLILAEEANFGVSFIDLGTMSMDSVDYPDYAKRLCHDLLEGKAAMGILICGSGQGMVIQANRFKGIRAALCWSSEIAKLSRSHNNSNVLCLAAKFTEPVLALEIIKTWLQTEFEGGRHERRTEKFDTQ
jgi:ribose 5-phosphate isomerase B